MYGVTPILRYPAFMAEGRLLPAKVKRIVLVGIRLPSLFIKNLLASMTPWLCSSCTRSSFEIPVSPGDRKTPFDVFKDLCGDILLLEYP